MARLEENRGGSSRRAGLKPPLRVPSALTVAGVDSSGGAGISTDFKTFAALGVHGASAVAAITSQNTRRISRVESLPPRILEAQIDEVLKDLDIGAVKTGVLYTVENVGVAARLGRRRGLRMVVDPIIKSSTGTPLLVEGGLRAYVDLLLPRATLVTPNLPEVESLVGFRVRGVEDVRRAAKGVVDLGARSVLVKGGHLGGDSATDLLLHHDHFTSYSRRRLAVSPHGAGCCLSSAITAFLARGLGLEEAVAAGEAYMDEVLPFPLTVGGGRPVVNPLISLYNREAQLGVVEEVNSAAKALGAFEGIPSYIAGVGTQVAMALPYPSTVEHVAGVEGRIRLGEGGRVEVGGSVRFGASTHMANVILACQEVGVSVRAAINLRFDKALLRAFEEAGFAVSSFDRRAEPEEVKRVEGESLRWGVRVALGSMRHVPDVIYDRGEEGKEAMIRVLAGGAVVAVEKVSRALKRLRAVAPP